MFTIPLEIKELTKMIKTDKVYVININNLSDVACFSIKEQTTKSITTYLLCKTISVHLLCRPGFRAIILESFNYTDMIKEIQQWLDSEKEK